MALLTLSSSLRPRPDVRRPGRIRQPRIVIVGAGMSGICAAIRFTRAGFDDVTILEKAGREGGTWRDNRYPGLRCDVPAWLYQYSFDTVGTWSGLFAERDQIDEYFADAVDRNNLRSRIRYDCEVASAVHDGAHWVVTTASGAKYHADFVLFATGVLHHPHVPQLPGRESFAGRLLHSARWEDDIDVRGKRVAVVGTGSTGVQLVSALAGVAEHTTMIARSPQWVLPLPNVPTAAPIRAALQRSPWLRVAGYNTMSLVFGVLAQATQSPGLWRSIIQLACRLNLRTVRDRQLRQRLTPDWQPLCKRLVMHPSFYRKIQRPDVTVSTEGVDHLEPRGIVTSDGTLHECDVIVLCTGFHAHDYMQPVRIEAGGRSLESAWVDGPRAYRSVSVPGLPNLFMVMGPHSPIGNFSLVAVAESQSNYILTKIDQWARGRYETCSPTQSATDAYNERMRRALPNTVWTTGCDSWYIGKNGTPELWPFGPDEYFAMMREPDGVDLEFDRSVVRPVEAAQ